MIAATAERLRGAPFRQVGGAADVPDADESLQAAPAAFVMAGSEGAGENQTSGAILQQVRPVVQVMVAVSRKGATGAAAIDPLKTCIDAVMGKLLGWSPLPGYAPFEYVAGAMVMVGKSNIWWQMSFATDYLLRKD